MMLFRLRTYAAFPLGIAAFVALAAFNFPGDTWEGLIAVFGLVAIGLTLDQLFEIGVRRRGVRMPRLHLREPDRNVLLLFCVVLLGFCVLDLKVNGLKILNPESYADLSSTGTHIRHISNMSWVFVVLAFFIRARLPALFWLFCGFLFPVLFVDRNRLLQALFCYGFVKLYTSTRAQRKRIITWLGVIALVVVALFLAVGIYRSGDAFIVESSGTALIEGYFPLRPHFSLLPAPLQQLLLYIASPIFNFAGLITGNIREPSILIRQTLPFLDTGSEAFELNFAVPRFNVGTEFLPFVLFGGYNAVLIGYVLQVLGCALALVLYVRTRSVFFLLLLLRFFYCAFMMGFAPQFFTYTNYGFVLICVGLWLFSNGLRAAHDRRISRRTPLSVG